MIKATEEKFRKELTRIINDLCIQSKKLYLDKDKFELIFKYYYEYRNRVHEAMDLSKHLDRKDMRMDRHKIAASFLCSILKVKPIGYNRDGIKPTYLENTANEQLGFIFGIYIVDLFNTSKKEATSFEMEIYGLPIRLPECRGNNDDEYTTHFTKLIFDEKVKKGLDFEDPNFNITLLFFLSHIFFLIDSFSYYRNILCLDDNMRK